MTNNELILIMNHTIHYNESSSMKMFICNVNININVLFLYK